MQLNNPDKEYFIYCSLYSSRTEDISFCTFATVIIPKQNSIPVPNGVTGIVNIHASNLANCLLLLLLNA